MSGRRRAAEPAREAAPRFDEAIWRLVRGVPRGRATSYAELAEAHYGVRRGARAVGGAIARCPGDVPWWRVVLADGSMPRPAKAAGQAELLRAEGVPLTGGRVDWAAGGGPWSPPQRHA